ncbi:MAG TPA: hypothetical protein VKY74_00070 [Chloroflexia bacterium]|nr:hypothetical protein [Chloroflexia bacterium]
MHRIGKGGAMAARAVATVRDSPRFADVLLEERKTGLVLFKRVTPQGRPDWEAYYILWARIVPHDAATSTFSLEYMRYTGKWQALDFVGSLEACMQEIAQDRGHVFFTAPS